MGPRSGPYVWVVGLFVLLLCLLAESPSLATSAIPCTGDCGGDDRVAINDSIGIPHIYGPDLNSVSYVQGGHRPDGPGVSGVDQGSERGLYHVG